MKKTNMTKEESKALYEGKYFYEIVKTDNSNLKLLVGPNDNIRYLVKNVDLSENFTNKFGDAKLKDYKFGELANGDLVQAFTEDEILVLDRKI